MSIVRCSMLIAIAISNIYASPGVENIARGTTDSEIDSVTLSYLINYKFDHYLGLWKIIIVPLLKFGLIVCLLPFDDFTQSFETCSESSHFSVG